MISWLMCLTLSSPLAPWSPPSDSLPPDAPIRLQTMHALQTSVESSRGVRVHTRGGDALVGWRLDVSPLGLRVIPRKKSLPSSTRVPWSEVDRVEARTPRPAIWQQTGEAAGYVGLVAGLVAALATSRDTGDAAGTGYVGVMALTITGAGIGGLAQLGTTPWHVVYQRPVPGERP